MKIGILGRILEYQNFGIQRLLLNLLPPLVSQGQAQGHRVSIFTRTHVPLLPPELEQIVIPVKKGIAGRLLWDHVLVRRQLIESEIDVLLAPNHSTIVGCPIPAVVVIHDLLYHLRPEDWPLAQGWYMRRMVEFTVTRSAKIIAISENTRRDIATRFGKMDKLIHVPPGPPTLAENGMSSEELQLLSELQQRPFILSVGSTLKRKNWITLLESYFSIMNQRPHNLVLVGPDFGSDAALSKLLEAAQSSGRVHRLISVSDALLKALYRSAAVFVFPSLYEGWGFPLVEALASNCPVLCSHASSHPEVMGDSAIYFEPENRADLSKKLLELLSREDLRDTLIHKGQEQIKKFSWEKSAAQYLTILEDAARS